MAGFGPSPALTRLRKDRDMAKKVNIVGTQPKRVQVVDKPVRRIEPTEVAAALGAEPCGEHIGANPDPISLAELGTELLRRLRSSGGRPALVDATEYCRVPLSPNDVKALERITAQIEQSTGTKPSPGQVASIIVREYLNGGSVNSQEASVKSPMPDSKPSLEHKLVDWLSREGYRLEYLTVEAFRAEGIDALLGYFVESTEGKQREIDVCAYTPLETFNPPIIARVFCECKYSA